MASNAPVRWPIEIIWRKSPVVDDADHTFREPLRIVLVQFVLGHAAPFRALAPKPPPRSDCPPLGHT